MGNQLLECRRSNVTGTLQENVNSLKRTIKFSNPQILPSQLSTVAVAERRMMAGELFNIVSKHLNVMQVYIQGQAFMSENTVSDFQAFAIFINKKSQNRKQLNDKIQDLIGDSFVEALKYMDSKRDRDTVIALMERITSVNSVAKKLQNVQNKHAVQGCRDGFKENLRRFLGN